jgi:hypothetical protein
MADPAGVQEGMQNAYADGWHGCAREKECLGMDGGMGGIENCHGWMDANGTIALRIGASMNGEESFEGVDWWDWWNWIGYVGPL